MALRIVITLIAAFWVREASSQTQRPGLQAWGQSSNGVRIGIAPDSNPVSPSTSKFAVVIQNTGGADRVVNLGFMLANGRKMYASAVQLILTDSNGTRRELSLRGPGFIAGRMDDFIVALQTGASYALVVSLDEYWSQATEEFEIKLVPGRYRIAARFDGREATRVNLDTPGIALLNFWTGRAESDSLEFNVGQP